MVTDGAFYYPFSIYFFLVFQRVFLKRFPSKIRKFLSSLAIFLFVLPFTIADSGGFNFLSGVLSLLLFYPSCVLHVFLLPLYFVPHWAFLAGPLLSGYVELLSLAAKAGNTFYPGAGTVFFTVYYSLILGAAFLAGFGKALRVFSLFGLSLLFLAVYPVTVFIPRYEVHFIDVGQGDCTLIRNGSDAVLIDTGGSLYDDIASECLIPYFNRIGVFGLDTVLISHTDNDHAGALEGLISGFRVGEVIYAADVMGEFEAGGLTFADLNVLDVSDQNEASGIFFFDVRGTEFLVMGDATVASEKAMLSAFPDLSCDVLRIGHHGSLTSTSEELLDSLDPDLAVISVGKNYYGHPNREILSRLDERGIPYWRTDLQGTLVYTC